MRGVIALLMTVMFTMTCTAEYVNAPNGLNVREKPTTESEVLEVLPFGTEVPGGDGDWIPFRGGYIASEWICSDNPIKYTGEWRITAYAASGSPCANGEFPEIGRTIAHNSLPFGTMVYIEGVGVREVMDRGPDYLGTEWCDLYLGDTGACVQWGDQTRKVWLLDGQVG